MAFKGVVANVTDNTVEMVSEMGVARLYCWCQAKFSRVFFVRATRITWMGYHSITFNVKDQAIRPVRNGGHLSCILMAVARCAKVTIVVIKTGVYWVG